MPFEGVETTVAATSPREKGTGNGLFENRFQRFDWQQAVSLQRSCSRDFRMGLFRRPATSLPDWARPGLWRSWLAGLGVPDAPQRETPLARRRLVYVVNRRTVVDQSNVREVERIRKELGKPELGEVAAKVEVHEGLRRLMAFWPSVR